MHGMEDGGGYTQGQEVEAVVRKIERHQARQRPESQRQVYQAIALEIERLERLLANSQRQRPSILTIQSHYGADF